MSLKHIAFSAVALAGAATAEEYPTPIYSGCLVETEATGRRAERNDEPHYQPYERANFDIETQVDDDMRISAITTCVASTGNRMKGFGFSLASPDGSRTVDLPWMGDDDDSDVCETLDLPGPLDMIRTKRDMNNFVKSISWHSGAWMAEYGGNIPNRGPKVDEWEFTEDRPVIGMYGSLNDDNKIKQLGWLLLNLECQAANIHWNENPDGPVDPEPEPEPESESEPEVESESEEPESESESTGTGSEEGWFTEYYDWFKE